jgi:peptide/nickel transport system permease protein
MPPFLRFIITRFLAIPVTVLIVTMTLYAFVLLTPAEARAQLYFPTRMSPRMTEEMLQEYTQRIIRDHHMDEPYPVQYLYWLRELLLGNWGYSPVLNEDVLPALVRRTPVTAEIILYSLLLYVPLGLVTGTIAGWKKNQRFDRNFRIGAFISSAIPTFILALVLLDVFYVALHWFPPERLSMANNLLYKSDDWRSITGLLTIDGLLNGKPSISVDALRHLVLPVVTVALFYWATLGRITRAGIIEESKKEYILAAQARGVSHHSLMWGHSFRNVLTPALTHTALSIAWLLTGVYVVEIIYNFRGISEVGIQGVQYIPDAPSIMGFAIYSVILVSLTMFALDVLQAVLDPRLRQGVTQ